MTISLSPPQNPQPLNPNPLILLTPPLFEDPSHMAVKVGEHQDEVADDDWAGEVDIFWNVRGADAENFADDGGACSASDEVDG
ncbi:hypothetical protein DSL72_006265 [Monilinia vaccinii-corymbosi]|uniref:Uncharacterized protein n=1 Tax=Monilinia vaccinii-corymbosi TaxID=61207 RepID=A0A8A3PN89_9HELO|nr:hypothetical protein DSL72_006265 [Monilinia vaccinii-corymbosi]